MFDSAKLIQHQSPKKRLSSPLIHFSSLFFSHSLLLNVVAHRCFTRLRVKAVDPHPSKCSIGTQFAPSKKRSVMTVKASSESTDCEQQVPSESKKEDLSVGQLLLEFKMQQMVEQKMRMKLAKKIRLCRKLLVRKRKKRK
ncbi:hypothetical protein V6N11_043175 [Hibiscus sabdariffa]|uniref:Uncharacterized protein n=1 Tax=Hibiscus sabdariffa TaxID=183260 RepID=A0ABR2QYI5_9ROSI